MCEEVWCQNLKLWQNDSFVNLAIFSCFLLNRGYACSYIVHTWGNQLVPELLLKRFDTLHIQYRYNEHVREEVSCQKKYFWQSDCLSNFLYGVCIRHISFLYWPLLCGGLSNKHCLLSFFHSFWKSPLEIASMQLTVTQLSLRLVQTGQYLNTWKQMELVQMLNFCHFQLVNKTKHLFLPNNFWPLFPFSYIFISKIVQTFLYWCNHSCKPT